MKKSISVFLVLAMLAALFTGVGVVANAAGLSYTAEVSPAELSKSTEAQEITIVFKTAESFDASSLECEVILPAEWTITELKNDSIGTTSGNVSIGTKSGDETIDLNKGKIFWYSTTAEDVTGVTEIATVKATIPANTSGDFEAKIENIEIAKNFGDDSVASSGSYTQDIKITGSTPPTPAADYTVTISDGVEGTAEVEIGDTVTMTVTVSGAAFNGMQGTVTYDTSLFDLKSVSGDAADDKDSTDAIELYTLNNTAYSNGAEVATLTFEAKAAGTGNFTVAATVGDFDDFKSKDADDAAAVNDSVKVNEPTPTKYTVTVTNVEHATVTADKTEAEEGETVTITATAANGWQIDSVSAVDATGAAVAVTDKGDGTYTITMPTSNITVTAAVSEIPAAKYEVELPTTVENATVTADKTEAAEGDEVVITVNPDEGYQVEEVTVKDGDGNTVAVTDNKDGTYTVIMPASKITVSVSVSEIPPAFTVKVTEYVTGINLVLVTGDAAGYTYNGQAMYDASAKYGEKVFAYLDETEGLTDAAAAALVKEATATAADHVLVSDSYEVNGTSKVDFNDAGAAFGCYKVAYTLEDNVAMYLRADVNGDKTADGTDVSAIMDNYS